MRLGIDLLAVNELDRLAQRSWFTRYVFADVELAHAERLSGQRRREFLAGRFAAKEAVLKVLGMGLFEGVAPRDVAVAARPGGAPQVSLHGAATEAARRVDIEQVTVSITHKGGLVAAVAMGW
ncbi:holo-ACP synthase [Plantactinospora sp. S1510]|uniref:Holo-ACP synthase n=1 Tax=Plantactinospora alkalitolerans TaxID=2789879 RepID=A0ABS0GST1_9ACTN|nr:holo-ACP synthase [Plantactinospora alkalitolerans]MBF9129251.1 holo-ACP synthase [Plantactinospora alkalitolerans]